MHIVHWSPEITLRTVLDFPDYQTAFAYFLDTLLLTGVALLLGAGLMARLLTQSGNTVSHTITTLRPSEFIFLSLATGFAIIIAELFIIALFGLLTPSVVLTVFIISALLGIASVYQRARSHPLFAPPESGWLPKMFMLIFVFSLLLLQLASVTSPTISDGTSYHAPYARFFLQHHGLAVDYDLIYPFHSLNINLLYSLGLMINNELSYIQSIHALFATLTMFGLYAAAIHTGQKLWIALLLPTIFLKIFAIQFGRKFCTVDLGSMFFIFAAIFSLMIWQKNRPENGLLLCSAICLGIAMGTKYIMCVFSIPIALMILQQERKQFMKPLCLYAGCAFLWGSWWYIRNAIMTGNPVHPFAPGIFGYYLWDERDMLQQMENLANGNIPSTLIGLLAAPYYAYWNPVLQEQHIAYLLIAFYIALPLVLLAEIRCRLLLIPCFAYLIFWVSASADARYLMPLIPIMMLYIGSCISGLITFFSPDWLQRHIASRLLSAGLGLILTLSALCFSLFDSQQHFINVINESPNPEISHQRAMEQHGLYELMQKAN